MKFPKLTRRLSSLLVFLLLVVGLGVGIRYAPNWQWMIEHEQALRVSVASSPLRSWFYGLVAYYLLSLIPGSAGKSVAFGWLFGFWGGLLIVEGGLTAAAITSMVTGRTLLRDVGSRRWRARIRTFQRHFSQDGAMYLLMLRLAHAPFTVVNYGAGIIRVPVSTFAWTTALGILPGAMVFVFAGSRIPSLQAVAEQGAWSLIDPMLVAALLLTATLPILLRVVIRALAKRTTVNKHRLDGRTKYVGKDLECHR